MTNLRLTLCCLLFSLSAASQAALPPVPNPPQLKASSWLLLDYHSGQTLAEHNVDQRAEPASITKLMTVYVAFQELRAGHLSLDDMAEVSTKAWRKGGSKMFIEVGKQVKVEDLLQGIIIQSGNDASIALAEHIAGGEDTFAQLMNQYAEKLGMSGTNFVNSTGWPHADHYTTTRDIVTLATALIQDFPEYYEWFSIKEFTYNGIRQQNRNKLLWKDSSVDGLKTGHTESAGYCLAASAKRDDMRLISVVLGTDGEAARARATQSLLNYGFRFYETRRLYPAGQPVSVAKVWKGSVDQVPVGMADDLFVTLPRNHFKYLEAAVQFDTELEAPLTAWQTVGTLRLTVNGKAHRDLPVLALQPVAKGGLWTQLRDSVMLMFE